MKIVKSYPECYLKKKVVQTNNLQKIIHNGNFQKRLIKKINAERCLLNLVSWYFLKSPSCFFLRCLVSCFCFQTECHQWCSSGEDRTNSENKNCNFLFISEAIEDLQQDRGNITDLVLFGIYYLAQTTKYWYTPK